MPSDLPAAAALAEGKHWLSPSEALSTTFTDISETNGIPDSEPVIDRHSININGLNFVINPTTNCSICRLTDVNPLLGAPNWVLGLSNIGGHIIPTFDLCRYFELSSSATIITRGRAYMFLIGTDADTIGIVSSEMPQRKIFYRHQQQPPPPLPERLIPYVPCSYNSESLIGIDHKNSRDTLWLELDVPQLLQDLSRSKNQKG